MVKRGYLQALDTHAYDQAFEEVRDDPEIQEAIDLLLEKMAAAFRRRADQNRKTRASRRKAGRRAG